MSRRSPGRPAATTVEFAVISPVLVLLLFGLIVGALGIFRYHQVASLAREAARYASVRGLDYERETGQPAATRQSIRDKVVTDAVGLNHSQLTVQATWDKSNAPKYAAPDGTVTINTVTVTVTYQWLPEAIFGGVTLTSTSKMPMSH
jgi:Flp pilus assembly protein TadG